MAPHSSTLAWKIPWMEEPGRLQSMGSLRVGDNWTTSLSCTGEGNGNPLQCSCLENPRDGGAWWAAIYGVAQSRTRLKWLSSSSNRFPSHFLVVVQSLSHVQLFVTLWTAACQASPSFIISRSLLKLMSVELIMLSNIPSHKSLKNFFHYTRATRHWFWGKVIENKEKPSPLDSDHIPSWKVKNLIIVIAFVLFFTTENN